MKSFSARSHPGNREGENEDSIGWDDAENLWLVADGMGGHASGQVASKIAKDVVLQKMSDSTLKEVILQAHEEIARQAAEDAEQDGMGTTIVIAKIDDRELKVGWVGDSRLYLLRGGELRQVTVDHTFVELLREKAGLTEQEIRNHPNKNILTQTLGHDLPVPSVCVEPLRKNDRILLCSDGLNDEIDDEQIREILQQDKDADAVCDDLISAALDNGGRDNVSAIVIDYDGESHPQAKAHGGRNESMVAPVLWGMLAGLLAVVLMVWFFDLG